MPNHRSHAPTLAFLILLALLALAAFTSLALLLASGPEPATKWAYPAATLAFLLSALQAAPILALISRLTRGYWAIPLRRPAELFATTGLLTTPLFVLITLQLPPNPARPSIWFNWPGAPLLWDTLALTLLTLLGVALLHFTTLPDRSLSPSPHPPIPPSPRPAWRGAARQWRVLERGLVLLGALYATLYVFVQLLLSADLALSLVPGWSSAIIPAHHAITGLQAALAATLLVAAALRHLTRPPTPNTQHLTPDPAAFHASGKLLLAFSLLWFYLWWSEFLTYWYGGTPEERWLLDLLMFGPALTPFLLAFLGCFLLPTAILIPNPLRNSVRGPTLAAALILIGTYADRVRLYVPAWSVAHLPHDAARLPPPLPAPPALPAHLPGPLDLAILVGLPAAALLIYLLALRRLGPTSRWEHTWADRLRQERPYLDTEVEVVGRPS